MEGRSKVSESTRWRKDARLRTRAVHNSDAWQQVASAAKAAAGHTFSSIVMLAICITKIFINRYQTRTQNHGLPSVRNGTFRTYTPKSLEAFP